MKAITKEAEALEDQKTVIMTIFINFDSMECSKYRCIALLRTVAKIYARTLQRKISLNSEETTEKIQFGFTPNSGVHDAIFFLGQQNQQNAHTDALQIQRKPLKELMQEILKMLEN